MPGKQIHTERGLKFDTKPDFWLRRWTHFPFYFEHHNPAFRIDIERVEEEKGDKWHSATVMIGVHFADGSNMPLEFGIPELAVGESEPFTIPAVYTSAPGQTVIRLPIAPDKWQTLYSYRVRPEEHLWVDARAALFSFATLMGPIPGWWPF